MQIYVRERVCGDGVRQPVAADRVVLFVHGAGTPAEVAFDVPQQRLQLDGVPGERRLRRLLDGHHRLRPIDAAGGDERSVQPVARISRRVRAGADSGRRAPATYPGQLTTIASDWNDIDAVVDYIRALRQVEKVSLVAWSLGGPRAGGYAAQHPGEGASAGAAGAGLQPRRARRRPPPLPNPGTVFNTQSRDEFDANWDRQVGCPDQYDPAVRDAVWTEMLASDPVGATWGTRRAPRAVDDDVGLERGDDRQHEDADLMVAGAHDKQVPPDRVSAAYADLGAADKVFVDLGCSSHNAMWETNHLLLFRASLEWLTKGTVGGARNGVVTLGDPKS